MNAGKTILSLCVSRDGVKCEYIIKSNILSFPCTTYFKSENLQ